MYNTTGIEKSLEEIKNLIKTTRMPSNQIILDEADLLVYLKVSKRCLAKWRNQGILPFHKLGGKLFYIESEVIDALRSESLSKKQTPKF